MEQLDTIIKQLNDIENIMSHNYDSTSQFPNWIVAIGTIILASIAIFGEEIKRFFGLHPKLRIYLVPPEKETIINHDNGDQSIYFHLVVKNKKRTKLAHKVNVLVNSVFIVDDSFGEYREVPIQDKFPIDRAYSTKNDPYYNMMPTIGPDAKFDIGSIRKGENNFEISHRLRSKGNKISLQANRKYIIDFIAVGENCVSKNKSIEISWNGEFPGKSDKIIDCFEIKEVKK